MSTDESPDAVVAAPPAVSPFTVLARDLRREADFVNEYAPQRALLLRVAGQIEAASSHGHWMGKAEADVVAAPPDIQRWDGFCEAHQPPHGVCACCEAVHADDERKAALARLVEVEAQLVQITKEREDVRKVLDENGAPTADGMGEFTLSGRLSAYINNIAEQLGEAEATLTTLRQSLKELAEEMHEDDRAQGDFYVTSAYSEWAKRLAQLAQADGGPG